MERHLLTVEDFLAPAPRHADEIMEHAALDGTRVFHAHHGGGEQVLINARRRERIRGADLAPVLDHGLAGLRAIDAEAGDVGLRVGENVVADPGERQIGDHLLVLAEAVVGVAVLRRNEHVVVGEHHALGAAGGAGRVEHDREVAALALRECLFPALAPAGVGSERLAPDALHLVDRLEPRVVVVAQTARLVVEHLGELRQPLRHGEDFVDLLLVLDHREGRLGVVDHVGHLVGDGIRVDRHRHRAERLAGAHRPIEARAVRPDHREFVAALEAEFVEADREGGDLLEHLRPGPGLPDAEVLVPDRRPRATHLRVADQELGKGIGLGAAIGHGAVSSWLARDQDPQRLPSEVAGLGDHFLVGFV